MRFKDFKTHTLYSVIYSSEAHFLYVLDKTENALYGYNFYFVDDEMEIDTIIYKEEIDNQKTVFREMHEGYSKVLIRFMFERLNGFKK